MQITLYIFFQDVTFSECCWGFSLLFKKYLVLISAEKLNNLKRAFTYGLQRYWDNTKKLG